VEILSNIFQSVPYVFFVKGFLFLFLNNNLSRGVHILLGPSSSHIYLAILEGTPLASRIKNIWLFSQNSDPFLWLTYVPLSLDHA
jgi:hypothetical protein